MEWIGRMTWFKIKSWKFEGYNDKLSVIESEKIAESEISDIVYETLYTSVVDEIIDEFYGDVEICGNKYPTSVALKSTDGPVYNEMRDGICGMKADEIIEGMPDKPTTYHEMINQCKIYWE